MTAYEIEEYLSIPHIELAEAVFTAIEANRLDAIAARDEKVANNFWRLKEIYFVQKQFLSAITSLRNKEHETAWNQLDRADIALGFLERNFDLSVEKDRFRLQFISRIIKEYQKLFPYRCFFSREAVIKAETCSICGKPASLRHPCGHIPGKLYMGELCQLHVTDMELRAIAIVTDPFDKYTVLHPQGLEYDYGMLDALMAQISGPYDDFSIEITKIKDPTYAHIGRNAPCPCGSGKKYKHCHLGSQGEWIDHYIVHMTHPCPPSLKVPKLLSTWKQSGSIAP